MKLLKVFGLFVILHGAAWAAAHVYLDRNQRTVLVVVDTSYAMKEKFINVDKWLTSLKSGSRYEKVVIGTDKAMIGDLADIKSHSMIYRTAFGRMDERSLDRYTTADVDERILLSDGAVKPKGWKVIEF